MKQLLWFVCTLALSLNHQSSTDPVQADHSQSHQLVLFNMPDFPSESNHEIPIYDEQTGEIATLVPASIAKATYIIINAPSEHRNAVLQAYGITCNIIPE